MDGPSLFLSFGALGSPRRYWAPSTILYTNSENLYLNPFLRQLTGADLKEIRVGTR